ncbi:MAG: IclR family transcriptional regulator [Sphingomonadales bacterium]|nr:IclR family transcriptional regulator [Sphingomonadales bacterium]
MRSGTPSIRATERSLAMLEAVLTNDGRSSIAALARTMDVPVSTAHRQVATPVSQGYLAQTQDRRHIAGPRLLRLLPLIDEKQIIANVAAPFLHRLARALGTVVQLGTLENEMVTYRIKTGVGAGDLFTRVDMQLEAYCSAIGKVLLADLPEAELASYVATGPFPALTRHTITQPADLRRELAIVRERGFALDAGEIVEGLSCIAVPIRRAGGAAVAALSASFFTSLSRREIAEALPALEAAAAGISLALDGPMAPAAVHREP